MIRLNLTPKRVTYSIFFFFNDTATTEIYTLSLHDALPIFSRQFAQRVQGRSMVRRQDARLALQQAIILARLLVADLACPHQEVEPLHLRPRPGVRHRLQRSEEHTSELQSQSNIVCRLLLEK